jgi:hypothetical protein
MEYDCVRKGEVMSRLTKYLTLTILILFILACNAVTGPIQDVQNLGGTAESLATAIPVDTLKSFATQMPLETLQAFATQIPAETLQAIPSELPDFEGFFNPEGTPVSEWNGIPIMPQATAGEEFANNNTYSFKVNASVSEAQEFYKTELPKLGWESSFSMPGNDTVVVQLYQKQDSLLTVTITDVNGTVVVVLTMG